jgi:hypothetical protein
MSKMGSHCSFGHLKHKLWPKEGPGVELPIWLPTTKSQESTRFTWLQTARHTSLESSQQKLQLCFRLCRDPKSARKVMGLQSYGSPNWRDFGSPAGVPGEKSHLDVGPVERCRVYYKGEGGGFPQVRAVVSLLCPCCPWLVLAAKVLQLCTNHFVWIVCRPVEWISLSIPSPISELQHAPLPLQVLWARECISTPPSSAVFHLDSHLSPSRSWECVNKVENEFVY